MPTYRTGSSSRTGFPFRPGFAYPLGELRDDIDRLWTSLTTATPSHSESGLARYDWAARPVTAGFPAINVAESDDCLTVEAELPGLDVADVEISVTGDDLLLKGARPESSTAAGPTADMSAENGSPENGAGRRGVIWHRRERGSGDFERRIPLPVPIDAARVEARLIDGVLTVTCPKAPEAQPRKIQVRSS